MWKTVRIEAADMFRAHEYQDVIFISEQVKMEIEKTKAPKINSDFRRLTDLSIAVKFKKKTAIICF